MTGRFAAIVGARRALVMAVFFAAAACIAIPSPAAESAGLARALNVVRANGCGGRSGVAPPLRENAQLSEAAKRATGRLPYQDVLATTGYRASRSALLRLTGDPGAKSIADFVAGNFCEHMVDPGFREMGIHQQNRETRIILAEPFSPPAAEASEDVADTMLALVNRARSRARLCGNERFAASGRLRLNDTLSRISLAHATDMARHSYLSHEGRDGSEPADRLTRAGYEWRSVGENIASGQTTPEAAVAGWLKSPAHCANLMASRHTEMGVAYSVNRASEAGVYWVLLFAAPR
ncbi:MAG: CAP domain-containing protein [Betaproteobacteria bacterium]|nr:CAP domain-containing protein [Betaproteobacteria bacterium]